MLEQLFQRNIFSLQLLYLISGNSFFQSAEFLYFMKVVAANHSAMDTAFLRRALATTNCKYTMHLIDISIQGVLLFQRSTCSYTFDWYRHHFRRPLAVIYYFQGQCFPLKQALVIIPFFKGIELIRNSSCSHPFDELPLFYQSNCNRSLHQIYCVFGEKELQQGARILESLAL